LWDFEFGILPGGETPALHGSRIFLLDLLTDHEQKIRKSWKSTDAVFCSWKGRDVRRYNTPREKFSFRVGNNFSRKHTFRKRRLM
jgi:hypothetical protein